MPQYTGRVFFGNDRTEVCGKVGYGLNVATGRFGKLDTTSMPVSDNLSKFGTPTKSVLGTGVLNQTYPCILASSVPKLARHMPRDPRRVCRADPRYKPFDAQHFGNGQSRRAECRGLLHLG